MNWGLAPTTDTIFRSGICVLCCIAYEDFALYHAQIDLLAAIPGALAANPDHQTHEPTK
jgi:hypothetical protein